VFLPAASLAPNPAAPAQEPLAQAGRGELILVVDDEHAFQEITKAILQKHGYRVLTASDGREGLEVFIRHQGEIDLVMTDMNMPSMGGGAFVSRAAAQAEVSILTISSSERDQFSNSVPGMPLLLKPFSTERLLAAITGLLIALAAQHFHEQNLVIDDEDLCRQSAAFALQRRVTSPGGGCNGVADLDMAPCSG
jgi:CheY-like chemotaxis protein